MNREPNSHQLTDLGILALNNGKYEEAAAHLAQAAVENPSEASVQALLGRALYLAGKPAEARPHLDSALTLSPGHSLALRTRGWQSLNDGDYEAARRDLSPALDHSDLDSDPYARQETLRGLAWCAYHIACRNEDADDLARAIGLARRILDLSLPHPEGSHREAHRLLGWCYQKQGDAAAALNHFDRALELIDAGPSRDEIEADLNRGRALVASMQKSAPGAAFVDSATSPKLLAHAPLTELALPEFIEIEPTYTCNLRCIQCHVSYQALSDTRLDPAFVKNLKGMEGRWVSLGYNYEPMAHPQFAEIIDGLRALNMKLDLITNGTLLTPRVIERIRHADFRNVVISFDGIRKETYERIRRHADHTVALKRIHAFKEAVTSPDTYFAVNNTLMRSSLDELPETVEHWERAGFDHLGLIAMVLRDDNPVLRAESLSPNMDKVIAAVERAAARVIKNRYRITLSAAALNHDFPLRAEYPELFKGGCVRSANPEARLPFDARNYFQSGAYPGMSVPCRSPFKAVRILHNGDVQLCSQFVIGNIRHESLKTIWYGKRARHLREHIRKRGEVCRACEYYNFCIKAGEVDLNRQENFYSDMVLHEHKYLTDDAVLEEYKGYNIVRWLDQYYGIPLCLGPLNTYHFVCRDRFARLGLVWAPEVEEVKRRIRRKRFYVYNPAFWFFRKAFLTPGRLY